MQLVPDRWQGRRRRRRQIKRRQRLLLLKVKALAYSKMLLHLSYKAPDLMAALQLLERERHVLTLQVCPHHQRVVLPLVHVFLDHRRMEKVVVRFKRLTHDHHIFRPRRVRCRRRVRHLTQRLTAFFFAHHQQRLASVLVIHTRTVPRPTVGPCLVLQDVQLDAST